MVTMIPGGRVNEYRGRSDDTKPIVHVPNGSTFLAIDTGDIFMFDAERGQWFQFFSSQTSSNTTEP